MESLLFNPSLHSWITSRTVSLPRFHGNAFHEVPPPPAPTCCQTFILQVVVSKYTAESDVIVASRTDMFVNLHGDMEPQQLRQSES